MRTIILVALAGMIIAGPALAQNTDNRVNSGASIPGQAGNKSGPPAYRDQNTGQPSQDQSKVPGLPGNKSGPAVQPPNKMK
jgi:hypothetical protein